MCCGRSVLENSGYWFYVRTVSKFQRKIWKTLQKDRVNCIACVRMEMSGKVWEILKTNVTRTGRLIK